MTVPTRAEELMKLNEFLIKAQEAAYMISHLHNAAGSDKDKLHAKGWMAIGEGLKLMQHKVSELASYKLH